VFILCVLQTLYFDNLITHDVSLILICLCRDPLGLCGEGADKTRFDRLRFVEVKHGRVAMLAIVGHMVTSAGIRLPGNEEVPTGIAALSKLGVEGLAPTFLFCGALELAIMKDSKGTGETVSDFRNGMFKWDASPEEKREKYSIELNNGRAAQMGILALMVHEQLPSHEPYMINAFLGYSSHFNEGF
jgi:hypothetical protein